MPKKPEDMDFDEFRNWRVEKLRKLAMAEHKTAVEMFSYYTNEEDDGRTRFGQHVLESFRVFTECNDARSDGQECGDAGYYIMLYLVEKLFPGIQISMDEAGGIEITHYDTHRDTISVEAVKLLSILLNGFKTLSTIKPITPYDIFIQMYQPIESCPG